MSALLTFEHWHRDLNQSLTQGWCITTVEMGLDEEDLARLWREETSPTECALYLERRFDLIRRDF